jgi:hypothetical protein
VAVLGPVWAFFGGIVAASIAVLALSDLKLVRGVKDLGRTARRVSETLNGAVGSVNLEMRRAEEGLSRIEESLDMIRDRR